MASNPEHTEPENDAFDNEEEHSWLPRTPSASSITGLNFSTYFDKVNAKREDALLNGLTLLDTVDTFFDARIDLFERQLKKQRERIQTRATLLAKERREKLRTSAEEYDRELQKFKLKVGHLQCQGTLGSPSDNEDVDSFFFTIGFCAFEPRH